jgi:hypothetical protein
MNTKTKFPWDAEGATYCIGPDGQRMCIGAKMGRYDSVPDDAETVKRLHLCRVPMVDYGCYDRGGAYWGQGSNPLWCAWADSEAEPGERTVLWLRARNRDAAKGEVWATFPNATFYR